MVADPITQPGVYDIDAETYHADPVEGGSLSHSGARRLLEVPPAKWLYEQSQPPERKQAFDLGHAVHCLVLGAGPELRVIDAEDWRSKDAREERDAAYADGAVPLLPHEMAQVEAMAASVRSHPLGAALTPDRGSPERVLVWRDEATGIWRRSMLDWLPHDTGRRLIIVDLKTIHDASDDSIAKAIADHGYHSQAAFYLDGARALGLAGEDAGFVFLFVEKTPPYLPRAVQLPMIALQIGAARNRVAIDIYAKCRAADEWPGYPHAIPHISLPAWAEARQAQEYLQ